MSDNACCFCGDDVGRYGHNPAPVSDTGRCCDVCNQMVVIPARMSMMGLRAETILPGNITDIIMDEYLEQGESYEDAQEYARAATEKLKLDAEGRKPYPRNLPEYPRNLPPHSESVAERKEIEARMLEIEDMENPSQEDLDNLEGLESRYFELTGTFGAEETKSQFPAEAIAELKRNIVAFTGGAMMLSVLTAFGGFLLGRKTKEC